MSKFRDLTGETFGMLYVLERAEDIKPGRPMWRCKCECGNTTTISSTSLTKSNGTRSCGCLRHKPSETLIDLTGQKFGLLTVLHKDAASPSGKAKWICLCKCGNATSVDSGSLRSGKTKSCGCVTRQLKYDLTGAQIGYLRVIGITKKSRYRSNDKRWKCVCQNCGRTIDVGSYWLRNGNPYGHCKCTRYKG